MRRIWWWRKNPIENEINLGNKLTHGNTYLQNMKDMNISKNHKNKLQFVHFSQLITIINILSYSIHILDINNTFIIRIHLQTESENTSKTKPSSNHFHPVISNSIFIMTHLNSDYPINSFLSIQYSFWFADSFLFWNFQISFVHRLNIYIQTYTLLFHSLPLQPSSFHSIPLSPPSFSL